MEFRLVFRCILLFSLNLNIACSNTTEMKNELHSLKKKNDSLVSVINAINKKYVFDSISVREIPNPKNTYLKNSIYKTEFVVVGHSSDKANFIKYDSIINGKRINADTLKYTRGSYYMSMELKEVRNKLKIDMNIINEYGEPDKSTIHGLVEGN